MGGKHYTSTQIGFIKNNIELPYKQIRSLFEKEFGRAMNEAQLDHIVDRYNLRHGKRTYEWQMPQFKKMAEMGRQARKKYLGDTSDRNGRLFVKVRDFKRGSDFIANARKVYQDMYGEVSKNERIVHLNGNKSDDRIENLEKISTGELAQMNKKGLWSENPEITKVGLMAVKLFINANKRRNNELNEEQGKGKKTRRSIYTDLDGKRNA